MYDESFSSRPRLQFDIMSCLIFQNTGGQGDSLNIVAGPLCGGQTRMHGGASFHFGFNLC